MNIETKPRAHTLRGTERAPCEGFELVWVSAIGFIVSTDYHLTSASRGESRLCLPELPILNAGVQGLFHKVLEVLRHLKLDFDDRAAREGGKP